MIFFTADTHFKHRRILRYCQRPFANIEEHDEALIKKWNAVVGLKDEVYVLGDFIFAKSKEDLNRLAGRLNGKKYLIRGNHDKSELYVDSGLFQWVKNYHLLTAYNIQWVLCHYPIWIWEKRNKGAIHLYGHVHKPDTEKSPILRALADRTDCFNMGVDVNDYTPVNALTVALKIKDIQKG